MAKPVLRFPDSEGFTPPSNPEAEQALLGILMYSADVVHDLPPSLLPGHFHEPFHARLFHAIKRDVAAGLGIDVILLDATLRGDPSYRDDFGGLRYLADLVDHAPPPSQANDYARTITDLAQRREIMFLARAALASASLEYETNDGKPLDAATIVNDLQRELSAVQLHSTRHEPTTSEDAGQQVMDWVDDDTSPTGLLTGLAPLDLQLGPLLAGDLILIGGRPGMGKSALASSVALRVAAPRWWTEHAHGIEFDAPEFLAKHLPQPAGVIEINGEMSVGQMARRHISDIGHQLYGSKFPTYKQIRDKHVSYEQRQMMQRAKEAFAAMPIVSLKRTGMRVSELRAVVRRQVTKWKREGIRLGLVTVDHVGLFRAESRTSGRYEAQTEIAISMKELADEIEAVVFALVQLGRDPEKRDDHRPMLADLRDSGAWEENADAVLFPFRDAYYAAKEPEPDANDFLSWSKWDQRRKSKWIEIIIGKLREGDPSGAAQVWADLSRNAIRGVEPEWGELV